MLRLQSSLVKLLNDADLCLYSCSLSFSSHKLMEIMQTYDIETRELLWAFQDTNGHIWYFKSYEVQSFVDIRHRILR